MSRLSVLIFAQPRASESSQIWLNAALSKQELKFWIYCTSNKFWKSCLVRLGVPGLYHLNTELQIQLFTSVLSQFTFIRCDEHNSFYVNKYTVNTVLCTPYIYCVLSKLDSTEVTSLLKRIKGVHDLLTSRDWLIVHWFNIISSNWVADIKENSALSADVLNILSVIDTSSSHKWGIISTTDSC